MEQVGEVFAQFMLGDVDRDDEVGGPTLAFRAEMEGTPCTVCSGNSEMQAEDVETQFFHRFCHVRPGSMEPPS